MTLIVAILSKHRVFKWFQGLSYPDDPFYDRASPGTDFEITKHCKKSKKGFQVLSFPFIGTSLKFKNCSCQVQQYEVFSMPNSKYSKYLFWTSNFINPTIFPDMIILSWNFWLDYSWNCKPIVWRLYNSGKQCVWLIAIEF